MAVSSAPLLAPYISDDQPRRRMTATHKEEDASETKKWHPRDVFYALAIALVHGSCVFAPFTFTWPAFWLAVILYILTGLFGLSLSYHRNLSHRSFKLPKYLEYLFAYFGLHGLQGDPIFWVSTHRYHHKVTDTDRDPHSPIEGFLFSHINWLFDYNKIVRKGTNFANAGDLKKQSYYRFLERTIVLHAYGFVALLYVLGGFPFVVWGVGVRTVCTYHVTFIVNSIGHIWGQRSWNTDDNSRNNWYIALLTFGDGWHNNHHAFEFSARYGLEWWQIDMSWYTIKLLEYFGLATDVKVPSDVQKQKMSLKDGVEDMQLSFDN